VVNFTTRPISLGVRDPGTQLNRRLGGPQRESGLGGEEKIFQPLEITTSNKR